MQGARLRATYISPVSPLYLPCISPVSPLPSPTPPLHLRHISPDQASASAPAGSALGFGLFAIDEAAAKKLMADCVPDKLPNLTWWVSGCPARCMIALEPDEWSHVVGTWDGATLHMYHNGVLADSVPYVLASAEEAEALHAVKADLYIGAIPGKGAWEAQPQPQP